MPCDRPFGLSYLPCHARKVLGLNCMGRIPIDDFDDVVFTRILPVELAAWLDVLPEKKPRRSLASVDRILPDNMINDLWKISRYIAAHGPSAVLASGLVHTITGKRRMGIGDTRDYYRLITRLDQHPPRNLAAHIEIIAEFQEEMVV